MLNNRCLSLPLLPFIPSLAYFLIDGHPWEDVGVTVETKVQHSWCSLDSGRRLLNPVDEAFGESQWQTDRELISTGTC